MSTISNFSNLEINISFHLISGLWIDCKAKAIPLPPKMSSSSSAIIQDIAEKLSQISSNPKFMQPKCINLETANLFNSVQEIAPKLSFGEIGRHRDRFSGELADILCEINLVLQSVCTARDIHKIASELKATRIKVEKISKKLQSNINYAKKENTMKTALENTPIRTLTISDKREDKENIINLLLQSEPCIVPIVHKSKSNSTEFARDIFEDKRVSSHFSRTVWVDASRFIDVKKLKNLAKGRPSTLFWVIKTLNKELEEKNVLLVLDDIKKELELGTMGIREYYPMKINDKIVILTTSGMIYSRGGYSWTFNAGEKLSVEEAWMVIKPKKAIENMEPYEGTWTVVKPRKAIENMELYEGIGKEILSKTERWGSTVQALRILLSGNMEVAFWKMIAESQFWRIPCHEYELLSRLVRLCYDFRPLQYRRYGVF